MKKSIAIGVTSLLVLGSAVQASAYFSSAGDKGDDHLLQVVYNADFNEVVTDMGTIGVDFNLTDTNVTLLPAGGIDYVTLAGVNSNADLRLAYFAKSFYSYWDYSLNAYFATTKPTAPNISHNLGNADAFDAASQSLNDTMVRAGGDVNRTVVVNSANTPWGYDQSMNGNAVGNFATLNNDVDDGEALLANLGVTTDYIDMYLHKFGTRGVYTDPDFSPFTHLPGPNGDYSAVIRLYADGRTVLNPVPIPGSILLFGSSLLGLFGIRRMSA